MSLESSNLKSGKGIHWFERIQLHWFMKVVSPRPWSRWLFYYIFMHAYPSPMGSCRPSNDQNNKHPAVRAVTYSLSLRNHIPFKTHRPRPSWSWMQILTLQSDKMENIRVSGGPFPYQDNINIPHAISYILRATKLSFFIFFLLEILRLFPPL